MVHRYLFLHTSNVDVSDPVSMPSYKQHWQTSHAHQLPGILAPKQ